MNKSRKLEMHSKGDEERKMKENFRNLENLEDLKTRTRFSTLTTHISGITLVALVVTIVVLLILAGVTITALLGDDGIIKKAQNAADLMNNAIQNEQTEMNALLNELDEIIAGNGGGGTTPGGDETPQIPEGLEIGSTVTYNPSGTYDWNNEYASSDQTGITVLNSATGESYSISTWKVLSINEATGQVELIAGAPTTGKVRLQGAQGYNNAVKLLNDACDSLYGDDTKGIGGRSVNIDDIEKYMTETALAEAHQFESTAQYGNQVSSAYSSSSSKYPVIYAQEKKAVITKSDGNVNNEETGLDLSNSPQEFIERSEGTSTSSSIGAITTATSIQPYQTYWYKDSTFMQTAFKEYKTGNSYYSLFMPNRTSTNYWLASRCVSAGSSFCNFYVSLVDAGQVSGNYVYDSDGVDVLDSRALLPVIALSSELIEGDATSGFVVGDGSQSP